jgi:hypothetical protein
MSENDFVKKINKSKSYILPLLEGHINIQFIRLIKNTYLHKKISQELTDFFRTIHILYDKTITQQELFEEYIEGVKRSELFLDFQETSDGYLLSLLIPVEHQEDYDYFGKGLYSHFKDASKKKILYHLYKHYPELDTVVKRIEHILYKNDKLKKAWEDKLLVRIPEEAELSSKVNLDDETYDTPVKS